MSDAVALQAIADAEAGLDQVKESSGVAVNIDGRDVTPQEAVDLFLYGGLFHSDKEKTERLNEALERARPTTPRTVTVWKRWCGREPRPPYARCRGVRLSEIGFLQDARRPETAKDSVARGPSTAATHSAFRLSASGQGPAARPALGGRHRRRGPRQHAPGTVREPRPGTRIPTTPGLSRCSKAAASGVRFCLVEAWAFAPRSISLDRRSRLPRPGPSPLTQRKLHSRPHAKGRARGTTVPGGGTNARGPLGQDSVGEVDTTVGSQA